MTALRVSTALELIRTSKAFKRRIKLNTDVDLFSRRPAKNYVTALCTRLCIFVLKSSFSLNTQNSTNIESEFSSFDNFVQNKYQHICSNKITKFWFAKRMSLMYNREITYHEICKIKQRQLHTTRNKIHLAPTFALQHCPTFSFYY